MAPPGPPPKPTHLKLLTGNPGRRPINQKEPMPKAVVPAPPDWLSAEAKAEWDNNIDELYACGLVTLLDRIPLAVYCQMVGRWERAERALTKMAERDELTEGLLIKTTNGNAIQNPIVGTANKAAADLMHYAKEFGINGLEAREALNE